jgi:hypothetical protein
VVFEGGEQIVIKPEQDLSKYLSKCLKI